MIGEDEEPEAEAEDIPNAADPASNVQAKKRSRLKADNRKAFWERTLADPMSRQVLWELLADLGTFEDKFACTPAGFPDAAAREFYAGQKAFGSRLYRTLMIAEPARIVQMHQEHDPAFSKPKPPRRMKNTDG